jgi:hypothetical protein
MEITGALRNEIFRPAVTLIAPGLIGTLPYIILLISIDTNVHEFLKKHTAVSFVLLFLAFSMVGLLFDNLGAWLESILDRRLEKQVEYKDHIINWKKYWRITFEQEPVGHRYLRTVVVKLKFELNTFFALPVGGLGVVVLAVKGLSSFYMMVVILAIVLPLMLYLVWDAMSSIKLLSDIRREILKGIGSPPILDEISENT